MKSIVLMQLKVGLAVVLVAALFGNVFLFSAFVASVTAVLPNVLFALYLSLFKSSSVARFFIGEAIKLSFIFCAFLFVWHEYGFYINAPTYWVALIVVLKAHGLAVLRTAK